MLLTQFLNYYKMVSVAPIITDIAFIFTFYERCVSIVGSLYFIIFWVSFLNTFLTPEIAAFINIHVPFSLSQVFKSSLFLGMLLLLLLFCLLSQAFSSSYFS